MGQFTGYMKVLLHRVILKFHTFASKGVAAVCLTSQAANFHATVDLHQRGHIEMVEQCIGEQ